MHSIEDGVQLTERKVVRRGLIAGLAAFSAAAAMKLSGKTPAAEATDSQPVILGNNGSAVGATTTQRTFVQGNLASNVPFVAFNGTQPFSIGLSDGLQGIARAVGNFEAGVRGANYAVTCRPSDWPRSSHKR